MLSHPAERVAGDPEPPAHGPGQSQAGPEGTGHPSRPLSAPCWVTCDYGLLHLHLRSTSCRH
jgi:hypothetical protein